MGGKNHQPCSSYLPESTKLSRALSIAYAMLELGNVALEDAIITEFEGGKAQIEPITTFLERSEKSLDEAVLCAGLLEQRMDELGFTDLPTLHKLDLDAIGVDFGGRGLVDLSAWQRISAEYRAKGFRAVLGGFRTTIATLAENTVMLRTQVTALAPIASCGEISRVLEENREGNIKVTFAKLYTAWSQFNEAFLASSLLSTELWYAFNNFGSLTSPTSRVRAA